MSITSAHLKALVSTSPPGRQTTPAPEASTSAAGAGAAQLQEADKATASLSLVTEVFMKKGTPKIAAQLVLSKIGMLVNVHGSVKAWKEGDQWRAGFSLFKGIASLGMSRYYNIANGLDLARETYNHFQAGHLQDATQSGARLILAAGGVVVPQAAMASMIIDVGVAMMKNDL